MATDTIALGNASTMPALLATLNAKYPSMTAQELSTLLGLQKGALFGTIPTLATPDQVSVMESNITAAEAFLQYMESGGFLTATGSASLGAGYSSANLAILAGEATGAVAGLGAAAALAPAWVVGGLAALFGLSVYTIVTEGAPSAYRLLKKSITDAAGVEEDEPVQVIYDGTGTIYVDNAVYFAFRQALIELGMLDPANPDVAKTVESVATPSAWMQSRFGDSLNPVYTTYLRKESSRGTSDWIFSDTLIAQNFLINYTDGITAPRMHPFLYNPHANSVTVITPWSSILVRPREGFYIADYDTVGASYYPAPAVGTLGSPAELTNHSSEIYSWISRFEPTTPVGIAKGNIQPVGEALLDTLSKWAANVTEAGQTVLNKFVPVQIPDSGGIGYFDQSDTALFVPTSHSSSRVINAGTAGTIQSTGTEAIANPSTADLPKETYVVRVQDVDGTSIIELEGTDSIYPTGGEGGENLPLPVLPPPEIVLPPMPTLPGGLNPSATAPGLIHVYDVTSRAMQAFGAWLWVTYSEAGSTSLLWNNPFDGVIGAFELYATPTIDINTNTIRSGFLTCNVGITDVGIVNERYVDINCGSVVIPEYYGNYLDYDPYTKVHVYLPFIGIQELSPEDIIGYAVNITYRVDCFNGSCVAFISTARENFKNILYQFNGSCSVELPMAGGTQAAIKSAMLTSRSTWATGLINTFGQLLAGNLAGSISAATGAYQKSKEVMYTPRSSASHSGSFGDSAGAMGRKKPYIFIHRPIQKRVPNYQNEYGFPTFRRVKIGDCTGYIRVKTIHFVSPTATSEEKDMVTQALLDGVFV